MSTNAAAKDSKIDKASKAATDNQKLTILMATEAVYFKKCDPHNTALDAQVNCCAAPRRKLSKKY